MSIENSLDIYLPKLLNLTRGGTAQGKAPHKPVLLITLIELFEKGLITTNRIYISPELVGLFKENWLLLAQVSYSAELTQPLFHLQNDKAEGQKFWFVKPSIGKIFDGKTKSLSKLRNTVAFAYLSSDLYVLFSHSDTRSLIKNQLLKVYFPESQYSYQITKAANNGYLNVQEGIVLNDPKAKLKTIYTQSSEEDIYVRSGLFKKNVHKEYNSTCSFSGMRLLSTFDHSFIDACHIKPFSVCFEDRIDNGIALCPNLHRAFDRGLISVSEDYEIIISNHITEDENHVYSLKQLENRKILLPERADRLPSQTNLEWHRTNIFKSFQ